MQNKGNVRIRAISLLLALCLVLNVLLSSGIFSLAVFAQEASNKTGTTQVLYVGGVNANDTNDGKSEATALATISAAYAKIPDDNLKTTIVICGGLDLSQDPGMVMLVDNIKAFARSSVAGKRTHSGEVVLTAKYGKVDHLADNSGYIKIPNEFKFALLGETTFENINIQGKAKAIFANYFNLRIGAGVVCDNTYFVDMLYLGSSSALYNTLKYVDGTTVYEFKVKDVAFTMESGAVNHLYGGGAGDQGWSNRAITYNLNMDLKGGTINNLYISSNGQGGQTGETAVADAVINMGGATVKKVLKTTVQGFVDGTCTVVYKDTTVSEPLTAGFDVLKLTNANVTASSLGAITSVVMDDDSRLKLTTIPTTAVNVSVNTSGTWNTTDSLITAPAGTEQGMFVLSGGYSWVYDASGEYTSWKLSDVREEPTEPEIETEPIPEGHIFYVDGVVRTGADGKTAETAFATLSQLDEVIKGFSAEEKAKQLTVVVSGKLDATQGSGFLGTDDYAKCYLLSYTGDVVFTSVLGAVDYRKANDASIRLGSRIALLGNTTFKNIKFAASAQLVFANYNDLELGKGVEGKFVTDRLFLGGSQDIFEALNNSDLGVKLEVSDATFTMKSGVVNAVDIFGSRDQGWSNRGKLYNATVNIEGGTLKTLMANDPTDLEVEKVYLNDLTVCVGANASAFTMDGVASNARIHGVKTIEYKSTTISEISAEGFDILRLINSSATLSAGMENLWSTIKKLHMTDDSVLTLTTVPVAPANAVEVTLIKTGAQWNTSSALIKAPGGTANIFEMVSPLDHGFAYKDTGSATWTMVYTGISIGTVGTDGDKLNIDLGLPEDGSFTPVPEDATPYETFLQKVEDLGAAKNEVNVISPIAIKGAYELYVDSMKGNDKNPGSIDKPFATIERALTYVEVLQTMDVKGVVVFLREGTYFVHESIKLNERHSGKNGIPLIISAYNNEKVVITSSVSISGSAFKPVADAAIMDRLRDSAKGAVVQVDLKSLGITQLGKIVGGNLGGPNYQIYVNGNEYIPARYPNATKLWVGEVLDQGPITIFEQGSAGSANMDSTGIEFKMQDFRPTLWQNDGNIWLKGSMYAEWDIKNIRVAEIRRESIKLDGGAAYGAQSLQTNTYYYYNILEELDAPGEYYVDLNTGILYLYSVPNMDQAAVTYSGNTDALFMMSGTKNVVLNGLTIEGGAGTGLHMVNCEQTIVQNATINKVNTGVYMNECKKSGIIYSEISEIANRPVEIHPVQVNFDYTPAHNFVQNCYIHNTGTTNPKYCGIYVRGTGNVVSHNLLQGGFSVSIYLQYAKECIVEYNEIVGSPTGTNDGGAIYTPSETLGTGNHIRYNYIHDIGRFSEKHDPWGVYFDHGTNMNFAYGNVMVNVPGGFHNNGGSENVIMNNVVMNVEKRPESTVAINGSTNLDGYALDEKESGKVLKSYDAYMALSEEKKNEYKTRYPQTVALFEKIGEALASETGVKTVGVYAAHDNYVANNIVYNHGGINVRGENTKYVNNRIFSTDPFVDVANHNFNLKNPGGVKFDYVALDMDRVGVITDKKQGIGGFEGIMPVQGEQKANSLELLIRWSIAAGADTYELKIATNAEMTENLRTITLETTQMWFVTDPYFNYDTTYYWTVTAYSTAESREVDPVNSGIMTFKTMTREEYLANNRADTAFLELSIQKAELLAEQIVAAGEMYNSTTLAELMEAINMAKAAKDNRDFTQVEVNVARLDLEYAMQMAKIKRNICKVTFDSLNPEDWSDPLAGVTSVELKDGALQMTVDGPRRSEVIYASELHIRDILCFKYKIDTKNDWNGFALAQTNPGAFITAGTNGYLICINPSQIELQKYYGGTKVVQIDVKVPMNLFVGGEYADVEVGAINYPDGSVGIHFKINGQLIFDPTVHIDTVEDKAIPGTSGQKLFGDPITGCGNFGIVVNPVNGTTSIMQADEEDLGVVDINLPSDPAPSDPTEPENPSDGTENGGFFALIIAFFNAIIDFIKKLFGLG